MAATCFVQPLDLVKNRMQVMKVPEGAKKPSSGSVIMNVVKNEGLFTLYNGLSAGLLRQATYTTTRLGIYTWLFETFSGTDGKAPGFFMKAALGKESILQFTKISPFGAIQKPRGQQRVGRWFKICHFCPRLVHKKCPRG